MPTIDIRTFLWAATALPPELLEDEEVQPGRFRFDPHYWPHPDGPEGNIAEKRPEELALGSLPMDALTDDAPTAIPAIAALLSLRSYWLNCVAEGLFDADASKAASLAIYQMVRDIDAVRSQLEHFAKALQDLRKSEKVLTSCEEVLEEKARALAAVERNLAQAKGRCALFATLTQHPLEALAGEAPDTPEPEEAA